MLKIKFCLPRSIRVKLNSNCQYKCKFCHQEGNSAASNINPKELISCLKRFKKELYFRRVHFTGGEPTLYKEFINLIKETKKLGINNSVTSNGQFDPKLLPLFKKAGLNSINFSIHSLEKYSFLKLQNHKMDIESGGEWAQGCINLAISNIINADKIMNTKVNCVVGEDFSNAQEILLFCAKNKIKLRLLNNLCLGERSLKTINFILKKNDAELVGHEITLMSSSHRLDYQLNDNYNFGVKCIRRFYLKSLCDGCPIKKKKKCHEGFYGIRLEGSPLKVRLCLYRQGAPFVQTVDQFFKSKQFKELKTDTENIKGYLLKDDVLDEQRKDFSLK